MKDRNFTTAGGARLKAAPDPDGALLYDVRMDDTGHGWWFAEGSCRETADFFSSLADDLHEACKPQAPEGVFGRKYHDWNAMFDITEKSDYLFYGIGEESQGTTADGAREIARRLLDAASHLDAKKAWEDGRRAA